MGIIIIVSFTILAILGYKLIDVAFGKAFSSLETVEDTNCTTVVNALLFVKKSNLTEELKGYFEDKNLNCVFIEEIKNLDTSIKYNYLIAASDSDLDNLVICAVCLNLLGVEKIIALCNSSCNTKVYEDSHIPCLFRNDISVTSLARNLFESTFYTRG